MSRDPEWGSIGCALVQPKVAQYPPVCLPLSFSYISPWSALYDVRVYHWLALAIYPFYFHIIFQ